MVIQAFVTTLYFSYGVDRLLIKFFAKLLFSFSNLHHSRADELRIPVLRKAVDVSSNIMANIEKIVDNLNLPKQLLDKSEGVLKILFKESLNEFGGMIADQVRLRRYKNQIKIFSKAQKMLAKENISPKQVSLKLLAPLIEFSSYEEDISMQNRWAKLTANILTFPEKEALQQVFIEILNKITETEANILDKLHTKLLSETERLIRAKKKAYSLRKKNKYQNLDFTETQKVKESKLQPLDKIVFSIFEVASDYNIEKIEFRLIISNLASRGLLTWKSMIEVDSENIMANGETYTNNTVFQYNHSHFIFTPLGVRFVETCKK